MNDSLEDLLYHKIVLLSKEGDDLVDRDDFARGLEKYHEAWQLIPEPKEKWEASTWLLSSIGNAHYYAHDYVSAVSALRNATRCPEGLGNPFIHLRLGESQFELGNYEYAEDELARAFMGAGKDIFKHEDPKYLAFLQTRMLPAV